MNLKIPLKRRGFIIAAATTAIGLIAGAVPLTRKEKGMLTIRRSNDRGNAEHGWLKSRHTFSFAEYYDPDHMHFGPLRVINEDRISGGSGFDTHPHRDMEIISYVVSGGLQHRDSMGNVAVIKPGEVQRMSAGTGVMHSEYNDEEGKETHFFQIWIMPKVRGVQPGYGQKSFETELNTQKLVHVISPDGKDGTIGIHQDADMYISRLKKSEDLEFTIGDSRRMWLQVVKGGVEVNGEKLETGDAIAATDLAAVNIKANADSEMILFNLP
ncbi:pirin family protein [Bdellovibrio sp. HCB274]|uniref:pirin family protein n=1 Tax=Bdellovibrio sp. HCB274 TaxID=3394361 RepID=UPI0039B40A4E